MRASTGENEMPFLCAMKDGQKGGAEEERMREREGKTIRKREGEGGGTFQSVFSIERRFDRAEPTLWQGEVEPFSSLLPAA